MRLAGNSHLNSNQADGHVLGLVSADGHEVDELGATSSVVVKRVQASAFAAACGERLAGYKVVRSGSLAAAVQLEDCKDSGTEQIS